MNAWEHPQTSGAQIWCAAAAAHSTEVFHWYSHIIWKRNRWLLWPPLPEGYFPTSSCHLCRIETYLNYLQELHGSSSTRPPESQQLAHLREKQTCVTELTLLCLFKSWRITVNKRASKTPDSWDIFLFHAIDESFVFTWKNNCLDTNVQQKRNNYGEQRRLNVVFVTYKNETSVIHKDINLYIL